MSFGFPGSSAAPVHVLQRFLKITIRENTTNSATLVISGAGMADIQTAIHNPLAAFMQLHVEFIDEDLVSLFQKLVQPVLPESVHLSLSLGNENDAFILFINQMLPPLNGKIKKLTIEPNGYSCLIRHRPQFFDEFPFRCFSTSKIGLFQYKGKPFNWLHNSQYRIKFFHVTQEKWDKNDKQLLKDMVDKLFANSFRVTNAQFIVEVDMGDELVNLEISKSGENEFDRLSMTMAITGENRKWYIQRGPKSRTTDEWKKLRKEALETEDSVPGIDINIFRTTTTTVT